MLGKNNILANAEVTLIDELKHFIVGSGAEYSPVAPLQVNPSLEALQVPK